ncbi:two-partner secretion domain-containing protein [Anabaena sp. WFMT]|uniref:two-partner secretion domain-containing protein n=1 Tax=Anabaena sp. WFMT TaxID=3449730 RepID=UPI003F24D1AA
MLSPIIVGETVVLAEIKPDTTLGNEASLVKQKVDIQGAIGNLIDGGAVRGANLFHSFREFSIGDGQRVYFSNPTGIENILTRVTGNNRSDILGTLGVLGNANLFFINPNGIVFGQNAQLDVAGSFVGSTADSFVFDNGFLFRAKNPQPVTLLTINVPLGLQYQSNSGSIQVQGTSLLKPNGKTIALVGGNVSLDDAILSVPAGRVELGGVIGEGIVEFRRDSDNLSLNFPESLTKTDIFLNGTRINVIAGNNGSMALNARNIAMTDSFIFAGIGAGLGSATSKAGDITLNAAEEIKIDGISGILQYLLPEAVGTGGDIHITTKSLIATNGAAINNITLGKGDAGNITITAHDTISLDGEDIDGFTTSVGTSIIQGAIGNTGNISITTDSLALTNGASIVSQVSGEGNAGNVIITANDISLDGENNSGRPSNISSPVRRGAIGNGGNISISSDSLQLTNGAQLSTNLFGQGKAGNVNITANNTLSIDGQGSIFPSSISSAVASVGVGEAGDINITTEFLALTNNANLNSRTDGQANAGDITINTGSMVASKDSSLTTNSSGKGNAGNVNIHARDLLSLDQQSAIISGLNRASVGQAGSININTGSLSLKNGSQLQTNTSGQGNAGSINIYARDTVILDGASPLFLTAIGSSVRAGAEGKGGNININSNLLNLSNQASLVSVTRGMGNAGDIIIQAKDTINLSSDSLVSSAVETGGIGKGGDIKIITGSLFLTDAAQLAAGTRAVGNAGNINIQASGVVSFDGMSSNGFSSGAISLVETEAIGNGGDIDIISQALSITNGAVINTRTKGQGDAGNINVTADTFDAASGGQLLTSTSSNNKAGDITLRVSDRVTLAGDATGLFANTTLDATGNSGNIFIYPQVMILRDGAKIAVDNQGSGAGGIIDIQAGKLTLDNNAVISAETASNTGGNIQLQLQDLLLLRRNSLISTTAGTGQAGGNGGNITINTPFIVAFPSENNDITANAFTGNGGSINITAQSIFGLTPRSRVDLERLLGTNDPAQLNSVSLPTSDITAISQANPSLNGQVNLNILNTDPNNGLVALPTNVVDAAKLIAQTCRGAGGTTANQDSEFIVTGRGGLPANPSELLSSDAVWYDLQPHALLNEKLNSYQKEEKKLSEPPAAIVEAQGWVIDADGSVTLVAQAPTNTPQNSFVTPVNCPVVKN